MLAFQSLKTSLSNCRNYSRLYTDQRLLKRNSPWEGAHLATVVSGKLFRIYSLMRAKRFWRGQPNEEIMCVFNCNHYFRLSRAFFLLRIQFTASYRILITFWVFLDQNSEKLHFGLQLLVVANCDSLNDLYHPSPFISQPAWMSSG